MMEAKTGGWSVISMKNDWKRVSRLRAISPRSPGPSRLTGIMVRSQKYSRSADKVAAPRLASYGSVRLGED
jgi:hypothetical protein